MSSDLQNANTTPARNQALVFLNILVPLMVDI